jgi:DNA-binding MarR family transcriptional regulator
MEKDFSKLYLENQLCFPLYAASRLTIKRYTPLLEALEITYPQYLVLLVLWEKNAQTVTEIGTRLALESNTLTPLLKRLEQKELLTRSRSSKDERAVVVTLTESGQALKEQAVCIPQKIMESFANTSISKEEFQAFQKTLNKLVELLREE